MIRAHILDALEHMQLLSDIHKMEEEPESDSLQVPEKLFPETAELLLVLLPVEVEMKNLL